MFLRKRRMSKVKVKAYYKLGNMLLKGYVKDYVSSEDDLYNFNTPERDEKGQRDLLVSATEVKLIFN